MVRKYIIIQWPVDNPDQYVRNIMDAFVVEVGDNYVTWTAQFQVSYIDIQSAGYFQSLKDAHGVDHIVLNVNT